MEIFYIVTMVIMLFLLVWVIEHSRREREQLYNRLMSRDYREFATTTKTMPKPFVNPILKNIANHHEQSRFTERDDE